MPDLFPALGYLRTSSATNVGDDKDSDKRQRLAISKGAKLHGYKIDPVDWFYDAAVSGDVPVADRKAFNAMLDRVDGNGVRTIFVESADRFARKMLTAEVGILALIERGVTLYTATGENLTNTDDEMKVAFRQIAMAFAQLEKTRLVKKLAGSRDRKSAVAGFRIEGRAGHVRGDLPLVRLTKALRNQGKTLAEIGAALAEQGHRTKAGGIFQPAQVKRLVEGIPFGYDKIAIDPSAKKLTYKLAPDDVEQAAIASARTLHSSGADITAVRAHIASLGYHLTMGDVRKLLSP